MRNVLAVCALLSSVLLHAQSVAKGSSVKLEAKNEVAMMLVAHGESKPETENANVPPPLKVSTGVIGPKLISEPSITVSADDFPGRQPATHHMLVSFRVDEKGVPQNVQLVRSVSPIVDWQIMNAVRQYRFKPATLDNENVPVQMTMRVNFETRY